MRRHLPIAAAAAAAALSLAPAPRAGAAGPAAPADANYVGRGLHLSPVPLDLGGLDRELVGIGSYIVNAQGGCNDCHTAPPYAPGGDPYEGRPTRINARGFLAGGTPFGPGIVSSNLTPDAAGLPGGMTYKAFRAAIREGRDPDDPGRILQVMPWPVYANMSDRDVRAMYEYLRAIPPRRGPSAPER